MECRSALPALDQRAVSPDVDAHIAVCPRCAIERRAAVALRASLVVEAPPELSARLLTLAQPAPVPSRLDAALRDVLVGSAPADLSVRLQMLVPGAVPAPQPRPLWVNLVYGATAIVLAVLLFVAMQAYGLALQELGVLDFWASIAALPGQWLNELAAYVPQGSYVVRIFLQLQSALQWVLIGLLMWAVLEMRAPRRSRSLA